MGYAFESISMTTDELARRWYALREENKRLQDLLADNERLRADNEVLRDELRTTQETLTACLESDPRQMSRPQPTLPNPNVDIRTGKRPA